MALLVIRNVAERGLCVGTLSNGIPNKSVVEKASEKREENM